MLLRRSKATYCFLTTWVIITVICYFYVWSGVSVELEATQRQALLPVDYDAEQRRHVVARYAVSSVVQQPPSLGDVRRVTSSLHTDDQLGSHGGFGWRRSLDYCNAMPPAPSDVTTDEGRVRDGFRIVGVVVVVRHGNRAPMYSLPNHLSSSSRACHVRHVQSSDTDRIQADEFAAAMDALLSRWNSTDPIWRRYGLYPASSTCSSAQLTAAGALQMIRLGQLLRAHDYSEMAQFGVLVRSTDYPRAVQSAAALLYGLDGQSTKLLQSARVELSRDAHLCLDQDGRLRAWNLTCNCRAALNQLAAVRRRNRTKDTDERSLRDDVASALNVSASRLPWTSAILEVLMAEFCANGTLHCDVFHQHCLTAGHLDRMWRIVDHYGRRDVTDPSVSGASVLLVYPLLVDMVVRLTEMAVVDHGPSSPPSWSSWSRAARPSDGSAPLLSPRLVIYSGHDKTLKSLLTALRINDGRWPAFAARVVVELAAPVPNRLRGPRYYFRLLYNGRDLTSSLYFCPHLNTGGSNGLCPLDNLVYAVFYHTAKRFGFVSHVQACAAP